MKAWSNKTWAGNICLVVFAALLLSLVCGPGSAALAGDDNGLTVQVYNPNERSWVDASDPNHALKVKGSNEAGERYTKYTVKLKLEPVTPQNFQNMWMVLAEQDGSYVSRAVYLNQTYDVYAYQSVYGLVYELAYDFVYTAGFEPGIYALSVYKEGLTEPKTVYLDFEGPPPETTTTPSGPSGGVSTPPAPKPGEPITAEVKTDASGNAVATVNADVVVQQAKEVSVQQVIIRVPEQPAARAVILELPGKALLAVAEAAKELRVETQAADFVVPPALFTAPEVKAILEQGGSVKLETKLVTGTEAQTLRSQVPEGAKVLGDIKELDLKVVSNSGTATKIERFAAPVWVTFRYDPALVARPERLGVYRYDEAAGAWVYVGGKVSSSARTVTVGLYSFSKYALMEYSRTFADISGHWAQSEIELMASRHVVAGVGENRFEPDRAVTRAEFAALLLRVLGIPEVKPLRPTFGDISPDAWYYGAAETARRYGLVVGYEDNTFRPSARISRQEMAAMLMRAFERAGKPQSITPEEESALLAALADAGQVSPWAKNAVALALKTGLVKGRAQGLFAPQESATRAESVTMLRRFMSAADLL